MSLASLDHGDGSHVAFCLKVNQIRVAGLLKDEAQLHLVWSSTDAKQVKNSVSSQPVGLVRGAFRWEEPLRLTCALVQGKNNEMDPVGSTVTLYMKDKTSRSGKPELFASWDLELSSLLGEQVDRSGAVRKRINVVSADTSQPLLVDFSVTMKTVDAPVREEKGRRPSLSNSSVGSGKEARVVAEPLAELNDVDHSVHLQTQIRELQAENEKLRAAYNEKETQVKMISQKNRELLSETEKHLSASSRLTTLFEESKAENNRLRKTVASMTDRMKHLEAQHQPQASAKAERTVPSVSINPIPENDGETVLLATAQGKSEQRL